MTQALMMLALMCRSGIAQERSIDLAALAQHGTSTSCWILIEGNVYDVTAYLDEHKREHDYDLSEWCGKDATAGWQRKPGTGDAHSRKAGKQLRRYYLGELPGHD